MSTPPPASNFIRTIIEKYIAKNITRAWGCSPGLAHHHQQTDTATIRTRFPPEPNGYLHIGHAKSIFLNFGLAQEYGGVCHLRFDDTNPEKESQEYVDSIQSAVRWLGFDWQTQGETHLYFASDYFEWMYQAAVALIQGGYAYVDSQTSDEIRLSRGTLTEVGIASPWRNRTLAENLKLFSEMREGKHAEGSMVLRAKIDMASANINLRDPVIYRIRFVTHHNTGDQWCIYPMYTFAHPIEDALECISHSLCTLEFEDQRPFYDWLLLRLSEAGLFTQPLPQQIEFSRLNLSHTVLSKRKLIELVEGGYVSGWDDPRLPTLAGARRRGYSPAGLKRFIERVGVSKADSWIDYSVLEDTMREVLNEECERRIAILDPLPLVIENYPDEQSEDCLLPNHPQDATLGDRPLSFGKQLWIERSDFMPQASKGFFRLTVGGMVRLRYAYVVECTGFDTDEQGKVVCVYARYLPDTKSGSEGANSVKVKGNIHWLAQQACCSATVRLYDRLFSVAHPDEGGGDYLQVLNPDALRTLTAWVEPSLREALPESQFQFERQGYFVVDRHDSSPDNLVFNRIVSLKDAWQKV